MTDKSDNNYKLTPLNKTKKKRKNKTNPVPKQSLTNRVRYYYIYLKLPDQKIRKKRPTTRYEYLFPSLQ